MGRTCSICNHAERAAIDKALLNGESQRSIASHFNVSRASVERHRRHIAAAIQAQQAMTIERLLDDLADLQQRALALLTRAEQSSDLRAALAAIREVRGVVETGARLIETNELRKRLENLERIVCERGMT